jgi:hypothetical protein
VSGARTLCCDDTRLETDFNNKNLISDPRGSIYKRPSHTHLLKHTSSCGRLPPPRRKRRS